MSCTWSRFFSLLGMFVFLSALHGMDSHQAYAGGRNHDSAVLYVAHDYGFTGPDQIPAGMATLQVVNKGRDAHHVQLLKLMPGKTAADFRAAIKANPSGFPKWVKFVGGPNAVLPGGESVAMMTLAEGEYLLICLIPNKEGVPHVALGMEKPLSVKGARPSIVSEPKAGLTITQADFRFDLSSQVTAGTHTIQVMNHGTQTHEVVLLKLDPGASAKDFGAAFEPGASGPPPGQPIGGVVGIETGQHAYFNARFEPGRYGLICFFPDPATGKPHFAQGMTSEFTVE
jgi:hypothetical protein